MFLMKQSITHQTGPNDFRQTRAMYMQKTVAYTHAISSYVICQQKASHVARIIYALLYGAL
jgi:hypothetical protein